MKISVTRSTKTSSQQPPHAARRSLAGATSSQEKHRVRVLGADIDDQGPAAALEVGRATEDGSEDEGVGRLRGWSRRAKQKAAQVKEPQTHSSWTGGPSATTRAITGVALAAIACGPIGLGMGLMNNQARPATVRATASPLTGVSAGAQVGSFASAFLVAWVRADQKSAAALSAYGPVPVSSAPLKGGTVSMVSVAGLTQTPVGVVPTSTATGAGTSTPGASPTPSTPGATASAGTTRAQVWTVRLAATVAAAGRTAAQRHYEVSVLREATGAMSVLAAPAVVSGPVLASPANLLYGQQVRTDSQLSSTTVAFLNALVAGQGDVTRYTTPGSVIRAVTPPAYTAVAVTQIASLETLSDRVQDTPRDGATAHVLVTASAAAGNPATTASTVQYALTMTARQGRWEVTSIDPVGVSSVARAGEGVSATANPTPGSSASAGSGGH